ncbi:hypothetical protein Pmani_018808 [Petrolisthes manimaculis]|uniref:Carboxylesterase type B domain-containing protein n=1 Tax=Petrolisthes manimaculis TaxID=1843537 RepID=A0AAE1PJ15_9EUCA|nr:hypothetical protein Pmani_018808 [Petrolisthes manimaculis]
MRRVSLPLVCWVWLTLLVIGSRGNAEEDVPLTDQEPPVIDTTTGKISGVKEVSTKGNSFYAYRSIPFAKPPLGELRFKDPLPIERWEEVRDGLLDPPPCPQIPLLSLITGSVGEVVGEEDCLYLNVFTPKPREETPLLPVMVFIHGGAWVSGGASEYPPHVLLNHDVVLVVIQYRLGLLGFMSTEDDAAPGNLGLKDQTLALTWIQRNAHKFGGDFRRVTVFGESAGAASVHYQILSHKSIGLFQRGILQSGSALCPWSVGVAHGKVARYTGQLFNCTSTTGSSEDTTTNNDNNDNINTSEAMIECLQNIPATDIVPVYLHFVEWFLAPVVVGPRVDGKYLPEEPAFLMKEARHKRVDLMLGTNRHEGAFVSLPMFANEALRSSLLLNFRNIGPISLVFHPEDISPLNQTIKIYDRYLGGINLDANTADHVTQLFSDRLFTVCQDLTSSLHAGNVARHKKLTFQYELTHRGQRSIADIFNLDIGKDWVSHMDELPYMFTGGPLWQPLEREEDLKLRDTITEMWTNFAATGNPTPTDSLGFKWEPVTKDNLQYLALQPDPIMKEDYRNETREFWTSLPLKLNLDLFPEKVSNLVFEKKEGQDGEEKEGTEEEEGETKKEEEEKENTVTTGREEGREEGQATEKKTTTTTKEDKKQLKEEEKKKKKLEKNKDKKYEKTEEGKLGKETKKTEEGKQQDNKKTEEGKPGKETKKTEEGKQGKETKKTEEGKQQDNKKATEGKQGKDKRKKDSKNENTTKQDKNKDEKQKQKKNKKEESGKKDKKGKEKKNKEDKKGSKKDEL